MLTTMRFGCCVLLALSACYAPRVLGGAPCEPSRGDSCPTGQTCEASAAGYFCVADGAHVDAGRGDGGVGGDGGPVDGGICVGKGLLGSICLTSPPTAAVTLSAATPINTASVSPGGCTEIRQQPGGAALCIIAGASIDIPATATVKGIAVDQGTATATNPIVLVATGSITIEGTLDVASHVNEVIAGMPVLGAGARTASGCAAIGLDGTAGKPANSNNSFGGGGGAGGSFGSIGGSGGSGGNNNNIGHGTPVAGGAATTLTGGCPGGNGGTGDGGLGAGLGGGGGGAVYLLAGGSITIAGKINASGAGGGNGTAGMFSSGAGGGGGSGGLIGLEAPRISITGSVFANGGGGASGNGAVETDTGTPGSDPAAATTAAPGGVGKNGGGNGGAGSTAAGAGVVGKNGSGNAQEAAGGGGGGGAGVIRVFGVAPASLGGQVSPPAS